MLGRFFDDRKNYMIVLLLVNILDITSTLHLVAKYGSIIEKNPIVSFMLMKPYYPLIHVAGYVASLLLIRVCYKKGFWKNFLWVFLAFYLLFACLGNLLLSFGVVH